MRRLLPRRIGSLGLFVAVLLAAGTAGAAPAKQTAVARRALGRVTGFVRIAPPFHAYVAVPDEDGTLLAHAYDQAVGRCMKDRGFAYVGAPRRASGMMDGNDAYGLIDADTAATHGYGLFLEAPRPQPRAGAATSEPPSDPARDRALTGDRGKFQPIAVLGDLTVRADPEACTSRAFVDVYGSLRWLELWYWAQDRANTVVNATAADDRFRRARATWSACMRTAGYAIGPEYRAAETFVRNAAATAASAPDLERAVARQDVRCAARADLWRVAADVQAAHEAAVRAEGRVQFDELASLTRAAVARAKRGRDPIARTGTPASSTGLAARGPED